MTAAMKRLKGFSMNFSRRSGKLRKIGSLILIIFFILSYGKALSQEKKPMGKKELREKVIIGAARNAWKMGDYQLAGERYKRAIVQYPHIWEIRREYAWVLRDAGKLMDSIEILEETSRDFPDREEIQLALVDAYIEIKDFQSAAKLMEVIIKKNPDDKNRLLRLAELHEWSGNYAKAIDLYRRIGLLAVPEEKRDINTRLARLSRLAGDYEGAKLLYRELIRAELRDIDLVKEFVSLLEEMGETEELIDISLKALKLHPDDRNLLISIAMAYSTRKDFSAAQPYLEKAYHLYPTDIEIVKRLGYVFLWQKKFQKASELLYRVLKETPNDDTLREDLANSLLWGGMPREALTHYRFLIERRPEKQIERMMLEALKGSGLINDYLSFSDKYLKKYPAEDKVRRERAGYLASRGRLVEAIREYETLGKSYPSDEALRSELANLYLSAKRYEDAVVILQDLLKAHPQDEPLRLSLARALWWSGNEDFAITHYKIILKNRPDDKLRREFADVLLSAHKYREAEEVLGVLITSYPDDIELLKKRLRALEAMNRWKEVESELKALIKKAPEWHDGRYNLARLYQWWGRGWEALPIMKELTAQFPGNKTYNLALGRLYQEMGYCKEAIPIFERHMGEGIDWKSRGSYIHSLVSCAQFPRADDQLDRLMREAPEAPYALIIKGQVLFRLGDYAGAKASFQKIVNGKESANIPFDARVFVTGNDDPRLDALLGLVDIDTIFGNYSGSLSILEKLSELKDEGNWPVLSRYVMALGHVDRLPEAYEMLDGLKKEKGERIDFLLVQGELHNLARNYYAAEASFRRVLSLEKRNIRAQMGLITSLEAQKRFKESHEALESLLEQVPGEIMIRTYYAELLIKNRQWEKARAEIDTIRSLSPHLLGPYLDWFFRASRDRQDARDLPEQLRSLLSRHSVPDDAKNRGVLSSLLFIQNRLLHHEKYYELYLLSKPFLPILSHDMRFMKNYQIAFLNSAKAKEALHDLSALRSQKRDIWLDLLLVRAYIAMESSKEALSLMELSKVSSKGVDPEGRFFLAELFLLLKRGDEALQVYEGLQNGEEKLVSVVSGLIYANYLLDQEEKAEALLHDFFHREQNFFVRLDLFRNLSHMGLGRDDGFYRDFVVRGMEKLLKERDEKDALFFLAYSLSIHGHLREGLDWFSAMLRGKATPLPVLWMARVLSWNKDYKGSIEAYNRYLAYNPGDFLARRERARVMVEKARVMGWMIDYQGSLHAYHDIVDDGGPWKEVEMEAKAKEFLFKGWILDALPKYRLLIEEEPANSEALFELGQIYSKKGFHDLAIESYRGLLTAFPAHPEGLIALERQKLYKKPFPVLEYQLVDQDGFDDKRSIAYDQLEAISFFSLSDNLKLSARYQKTFFRFDTFKDFSGDQPRIDIEYLPNIRLSLKGFFSYPVYQRINEENANFGFGASYAFDHGLEASAGYHREDLWENVNTLLSNVYFDRFFIGGRYLNDRFHLDGLASFSYYSDDNVRPFFKLRGSYDLMRFPTILKAIIDYEFFDFRKETFYFSPDNYSLVAPYFQWRHYLNKDFFHEADEIYYDLLGGFRMDSMGNFYTDFRAEARYEWRQRIEVGLRAQFIDSDVYREQRVVFSVAFRF